MNGRRWCEWCRVEPIPFYSRRDRVTCSSACHRARARARAVGFLGSRTDWRRHLAGQLAWIPPVTATAIAGEDGAE